MQQTDARNIVTASRMISGDLDGAGTGRDTAPPACKRARCSVPMPQRTVSAARNMTSAARSSLGCSTGFALHCHTPRAFATPLARTPSVSWAAKSQRMASTTNTANGHRTQLSGRSTMLNVAVTPPPLQQSVSAGPASAWWNSATAEARVRSMPGPGSNNGALVTPMLGVHDHVQDESFSQDVEAAVAATVHDVGMLDAECQVVHMPVDTRAAQIIPVAHDDATDADNTQMEVRHVLPGIHCCSTLWCGVLAHCELFNTS